jgi:arylsulfatase A-like enzyme/cytochrome c-type biogenesis protein CcmH/NrfG
VGPARNSAWLAALLCATLTEGCDVAPSRPPIVLISIDTLRSDHLPAYGYRGVATPAIDALRRDAVLFTRAYTHVPLTLPAHASLLSGRLPGEHGVRDNLGYNLGGDVQPWLPELLRDSGYAVGGVVSAIVLRRETGLARGFDHYDDQLPPRRGLPAGGVSRSGAASLEAADAWLRSVDQRPAFLFFHIYEPHFPYTPPPPFAERYVDAPYDGEIAEADRLVGELIGRLRRLKIYESALVILLSDHGEGLGDHGEEEHGVLLYREALQVPLLLKLPGSRRAGDTVAAPAQLVDIVPTVAALLDLELPSDLLGASLLDLPLERRIYAESHYGEVHYGWHALRSLVEGDYHFIDSSELELYDLARDPAERRNLAAERRRMAATLRAAAAERAVPLTAARPESPEARRGLAALGYLGGGGPATAGARGELPPPQHRVHALRELSAAVRLLQDGETEAGAARLAEFLEREPLIVDGWERLGRAHGQLGRWSAALAAFERAFEISGHNPDRSLAVALAKLELGRTAEALALVRWAQAAGALDTESQAQFGRRLLARSLTAEAESVLRRIPSRPGDGAGLAALAELLASSGRTAEALAAAQEAAKLAPQDADAYEQLALAHLQAGESALAREAGQRSVELDPQRANAWNLLGVALYQVGQRDAALSAWARAVEVNPNLYDTLYNLGIKAAEAGRNDQAAWALRRFLASAPSERYGGDFPRVRALLATLDG